jgi:23S rRNA pseudouridine1911/1915/1917 synthase
MTTIIKQNIVIPTEMNGMRLDQALAKLLPDYSRTQIQEWIKQGSVLLNEKVPTPRTTVIGTETVTIDATLKPQPTFAAQAIDLNIVYEDEHLLVINKAVGMVVHPAAGNFDSTLLNALLHHAPVLQQLPRAGIIHRLDKDTSGLLVIAKTPASLTHLSRQLKKHSMQRIYQAIVCGVMASGGTVDQPIARHPIVRKKMTVIETGKPSVTHYRVVEKYRAHTRLKLQLETGRTHQIRVHMAYINYPILGDPTYGGRFQIPKKSSQELIDAIRQFKRQALHACELSFVHPATSKEVKFEAPLPADMQHLIQLLKKDAQHADKT